MDSLWTSGAPLNISRPLQVNAVKPKPCHQTNSKFRKFSTSTGATEVEVTVISPHRSVSARQGTRVWQTKRNKAAVRELQ